ncbi:MAG: tRNA (adenosine(37)-N6)-dimethylallyltransferase MiaA [bacterium]
MIFIVGPTASGKSALAIEVAKSINGEIICADSRTVYTGLDVSTAKPTAKDRAEVPHWGLDLVDPSERFSAADFKVYAQNCIVDIQNRGKLPIIVGGTGLYIDGLLFDFKFGPGADQQLRQKLEPLSIDELQETINKMGIDMPENSKNKRYLIRAIEQGGINKQKNDLMLGALVIGINPGMPVLEQRIKDRSKEMLDNGAIKEAQWLFDKYGNNVPAASAPFFKAYAPHFLEGQTLQECMQRDITLNRQLAKRQIAWFKRNPHIQWFDSADLAFMYATNILIENNKSGKNSSNAIPK